ncbi:MAG: TRAP transporter small permease subunit [Alphaproteobacteria bacterium]|nr:TRAP transporter small permease subunit [Alphaproteobacteria bacterium]
MHAGGAGAAPPAALLAFVRGIDRLAVGCGYLFCWLAIPLVLCLTYEVIARYAFHAPTIWAFDITYMLYGSHFMLGAAYALYRGAHIRTDVFYQNWSYRTRGLVDAGLYLFFFFPGMIFFFWMGLQEALHAIDIREVSDQSPWRPPLYPFKTVIPIAAVLLIVQGTSEFLKAAYAAMKGRPL